MWGSRQDPLGKQGDGEVGSVFVLCFRCQGYVQCLVACACADRVRGLSYIPSVLASWRTLAECHEPGCSKQRKPLVSQLWGKQRKSRPSRGRAPRSASGGGSFPASQRLVPRGIPWLIVALPLLLPLSSYSCLPSVPGPVSTFPFSLFFFLDVFSYTANDLQGKKGPVFKRLRKMRF